MLLGDYGAEVIKIEAPGRGDDTRQWGPPWAGDQSAYFLSVNRNKSSLTLNLKEPKGQKVLKKLAAISDVLIENFKFGTMKRLDLDYESIKEINPGLIYCSITGYGQDGPYNSRPGYDFVIQAEGGIMSITGPIEGPPHKVGVAVVDITAGLFAASAILAALHHRNETGLGQFYEVFETQDGHIAVGIGNDNQYQRFCLLSGQPELWEEEKYQTNPGRVEHRDELISKLQKIFRKRTIGEWLVLLEQEKLPAAPINNIAEVLEDPQVLHRKMVQTVQHPTAGEIKILGPVAKMSGTPARIHSPPPRLGAHNTTILNTLLGYSKEEIEQLEKENVI
jgi:formyl-CoA transferase